MEDDVETVCDVGGDPTLNRRQGACRDVAAHAADLNNTRGKKW